MVLVKWFIVLFLFLIAVPPCIADEHFQLRELGESSLLSENIRTRANVNAPGVKPLKATSSFYLMDTWQC